MGQGVFKEGSQEGQHHPHLREGTLEEDHRQVLTVSEEILQDYQKVSDLVHQEVLTTLDLQDLPEFLKDIDQVLPQVEKVSDQVSPPVKVTDPTQ